MKPHLSVSAVGRPREVSLRQVINAILYSLKTGCQWRQLPREFPAWTTVYTISDVGRLMEPGHGCIIYCTLGCGKKAGRHKHSTADCLDSQSVKCTVVPGGRGFDAEKLINGRKRHLLLEILGWLISVSKNMKKNATSN